MFANLFKTLVIPSKRDRSTQSSQRRRHQRRFEPLEARQMLAADLIITEFMASNRDTLLDGDGQSSDWIEIFNAGDTSADLAGWYLTDDPADLQKWTFPDASLSVGESMLVFASGQAAVDTAGNLHTNFQLNASGDYLALVMPDGLTVVSQFGLDGTFFPKQFEDISYGIEQAVAATSLISTGDSARWIIPTDDSLDAGPVSWIDPDFVDDAWQSGITGIGFAAAAGGEIILPQIDGLRANFAADGIVYTQGTTPATDGQSVQTWVDPAGVADNATQSQSSSRPTWVEAGIDVGGGLFRPVVRFAGSFLEMNSVADVPSGSDQAMTIVAVAKFNGTARTTLTGFGSSTSTTPLHQIRPTRVSEGDQYLMQRRDSSGAPKDARGGSLGRPENDFELLMAIDTGTQGSMFVDGVAVFENQNLDVGAMSLDQAAIGALPLGANRWDQLDGDIAELLIYDRALTPAEQSLLGEYLAAKYVLDTTYGEFTPLSPIVDLVETDVQAVMLDVSASLYMRQEFLLDAGETLSALTMRVKYNDGFVAYLNGQEVARRNAPASPNFASTATAEHSLAETIVFEEIDLMDHLDKLREGTNVLAIRGLNITAEDDDFLIITELSGEITATSGDVSYFTQPTPGGVNQFPGVAGFVGDTKFSVDRGFFETPFLVQITSTSSDADIYYTTNGSAPSPQNPAALLYDSQTPLTISQTTTLRAAAFKTGYQPSNVDTQTYFFLADVITQSQSQALAAGFPTEIAAGVNGDFAMDPDVVSANPTIAEDLKSIPTISVVMDFDDLFNQSADPAIGGIYANSTQRGRDWERPASIEYLDEASGERFQIDAGIRIQGGGQRAEEFPKHSFSLRFREEYGDKKLKFPLFGEDYPVDTFDQLVLRSQHNMSWVRPNGGFGPFERPKAQYVRDEFARDLQRDMSGLSSQGTFVHLYLNGQYWGLYNVVERPTAEFAEEHLGGDADDYDVIKHQSGVQNSFEIVDGDSLAWNEMFALAGGDLSSPEQLDAIGQRLDLEQFTDYLINQFFLGNQDWPSRNWYAIRERTPDAGFQFFVWDSEYTLAKQAPGGTADVDKTDVSNANSPGFLYSRLRTNPEFIRLFGDRVQKHLFGEGVLTVSALQQRYSELADGIDRAIVGESARWGDYRESVSGVTYTRDEYWVTERDDLISNFIPERYAIVLQQFRDAGLYPDVVAPALQINGSERYGGQITAGDLLSMITPETVSFTETVLVAAGDAVRAFVPNVTNTFDAGPGLRWYENGFDPATDGLGLWTDGSSGTGVGYEDSADLFDSLIQTDINANWNLNESSAYLRITFDEIVDPGQFDQLSLGMKYDDGFVAYLNGQEVLRSNAPAGVLSYDTRSASPRTDQAAVIYESFDISQYLSLLRGVGEGANVLAIQGLNWSASSSDLLIVPQLIGGVQDGQPAGLPIWFTTDGSDPRDAVTGLPSTGAMLFENPLPLNASATVRARALDDTQWSTLSEALFSVDVPLRISEIMYNPGNPSPDEIADGFTDDDDFEFIELVNVGANTINLDGIRFADGIGFTFGDIDLDPNDRILVVRNTLAIESRYRAGLNIAGQYGGGQTAGGLFGLSNNRETIALHDAGGAVIQEFLYDDIWYDETDGDGFSLVAIDTGGDYNDRANWRSSALIGGSPDVADPTPAAGDFSGDGLTDRRDAVRLLMNFGSATGRSRFRGDLNDDGASGLTDLALLQAGFGSLAAAPPLPSASAVISFQVSPPERQKRTITALRRRTVLQIDTSAVDHVLADEREVFTPAPVRHRLLSVRHRRIAQSSGIILGETE